MPNNKKRIAVFGASGSIGRALVQWFSRTGWSVLAFNRSGKPPEEGKFGDLVRWFPCDPETSIFPNLSEYASPFLDAAVWSQGINFNDNVYQFNKNSHEKMYRANVLYILETMGALVQGNHFISPGRLCIISSIWQNLARQNKLSYSITKAALQGLVLSTSLDLGKNGHLINAVLPGAIETSMTRANLNPDQIEKIESSTYFNKLTTLEDVCSIVGYLCSPANTGITGQFITADLGFSHARII